jgi:uncharacterized protein
VLIPKRYFIIPFEGLSEGEHSFDFEFSDSFFEEFEGSLLERGSFTAKMVMDKRSNMMVLSFEIAGIANLECDLCAEPLDVEITCSDRLIVKYGVEGEETSHEIVHIPESAYELNVAPYIYEFIALALPLKNVHEEGECNPEAIELLRQLNAPASENTDPRWDQLNDFINDN